MNQPTDHEALQRDGPTRPEQEPAIDAFEGAVGEVTQEAEAVGEQQPQQGVEAPVGRDVRAERLGSLAIYAASLPDYNHDILHGEWIEADEDEGVMQDAVTEMLERSPTQARGLGIPEEWAIHDHQGFRGLRIPEFTSLEEIARLTQAVNEHGPAVLAWATIMGDIDEATISTFQDAYLGQWRSLKDYAQHFLEDLGLDARLDETIPDGLRPYVKIDAAGYARDLEASGEMITSPDGEGGVWVWWVG